MFPSPSDAVERRRQQNRDAQRKRRKCLHSLNEEQPRKSGESSRLTFAVGNALKFQIEELQARNVELQAFKDATLRATKGNLSLPSPSTSHMPDLSSVTWHGPSSSDHDSTRPIAWDERKMAPFPTLQPYFPNLDEELLTINAKPQLQSPSEKRAMSTRRRQNTADEVGGAAPQNADSRSVSCEDAYMDTHTPASTPTSGTQDVGGDFVGSPLDPETAFDSLQALSIPSPGRSPRISKQGARTAVARRSFSTSTGSGHKGKRQAAMKIAIANRQTSIVRLLIRHGENVNARDETGRTVLHYAAETNDGEMAQLLLDHRADSDVADGSGMTPLEVAASLGNVEVAEVLLRTSSDGDCMG